MDILLNKLIIPSVEDFKNINSVEKMTNSSIDEKYVFAEQLYRLFFGNMLVEKFGLERLDRRIRGRGYKKTELDCMDFFQKTDMMGLDYLFTRCIANIERLSEDTRSIFEKYDANSIDKYKAIVEKTYNKVMVVSDSNPYDFYVIKETLDNSFVFKGEDIVLSLKSVPTYDDKGEFQDEKIENKRINNFLGIKPQLEKILSDGLNNPVKIVVELL